METEWWRARVQAWAVAGLLCAAAASAAVLSVPVAARTTARSWSLRGSRNPLFGVTLDEVNRLPQVLTVLRRMPQRPTARVYFDAKLGAPSYVDAVRALRPVANVMGELLDSSDERAVGVGAYRRRVRSYVSTLGAAVAIWEIGNEVNGNWTGPYATVAAKLRAGYDAARGRRTALTLYYNVGCGDGRSELDPLAFSRRWVSPTVRRGLNYVLLSYYEQQCGERRPSARTWTRYFQALHTLYPNARLGFGEVGLPKPVSGRTLVGARNLMTHYYGLRLGLPYYVGGYFWWYFAEDCLLGSRPSLGSSLNSALIAERAAMRRASAG